MKDVRTMNNYLAAALLKIGRVIKAMPPNKTKDYGLKLVWTKNFLDKKNLVVPLFLMVPVYFVH